MAEEANSGGDGALGKGMIALLLMIAPVVCWVIYGIVYLFQHLHFS